MSQILAIITSLISLLFHQPVSLPTTVITNTSHHYLIFEQKITLTEKNKHQVELKIFNQKHQPFSHCYVSIYNQDKNYYTEYPFPILKTDDAGLVTFFLPSGNFLLIASSEEPQPPNKSPIDFPFFIINHHFQLNNSDSSETYNIDLTKNQIGFKNINNIPPFKLEASLQVIDSVQTLPAQPIANNLQDRSNITFYTNPGIYNLNLDQKEFSPQKNITYALSKFDFKTPIDTDVVFDFSQLNTSTISMKGIDYAWFKIVSRGVGDFQSMYFGQPVTIKTNTNNLFLEMVYIPSRKCTQNQIDKKNSFEQIIYKCGSTDIRYDYIQNQTEAVYLKSNQQLNILPPEKLEINLSSNTINRGDDVNINFFLNNSLNQKIDHVYIHQLWDQDIMPQYTFVNSQNQISLQAYPFSHKPSSNFKEKISLPVDKYQIKSSFPVLLWGNSQLFTNTQKFEVLPGEISPSIPNNSQLVNPNTNYSNWEELYQNRNQLYSQSSGYLQTFPQFGNNPSQLDISQNNYVNKCSDLETINNQFPIIIDLNQNNTFDSTISSQFKDCLQKYVAKNYQKIFLLKNSFTEDAFASKKSYIFYYYYLLLHQGKANQVGIIVDIFYDIFYGFPEFYLISSGFQANFFSKDILQKIISDYQLIVDPKIIFYQ